MSIYLVFSLCVLPHAGPAFAPAELVKQLGDTEYERREWATRMLAGLSEVPTVLQRACDDSSPEIRRRARRLVEHITKRRLALISRWLKLKIDEGRFDLLPDAVISCGDYDTDNDLFKLANIAAIRLVEKSNISDSPLKVKRTTDILPDSFLNVKSLKFPDGEHKIKSISPRSYLIQNQIGLVAASSCYSNLDTQGAGGIFLVQDRFTNSQALNACIVVANGPVIVGESIDFSIIISNSDVQIPRNTSISVVIGQNISISHRTRVAGHMTGVTLVARNKVTGMIPENKQGTSILLGEKRPLGLIRFFEVSDVGLTLDACKVTKVAGPLAKAGVKPGDVFTHVDGVAVKDAEALRKALRRRYAILGYGAFTLTREGKPLTVVAELGE